MSLTFRYSCLVVPDVPRSIEFYRAAFGFALHFMHDTRGYAELDTGATLLAFLGEKFLDDAALFGATRVRPNRPDADPAAGLVGFVTRDIDADWVRAVAAGATVVKAPELKPWGQVAGYLRDLDGNIVELCTPSLPGPRPRLSAQGRASVRA